MTNKAFIFLICVFFFLVIIFILCYQLYHRINDNIQNKKNTWSNLDDQDDQSVYNSDEEDFKLLRSDQENQESYLEIDDINEINEINKIYKIDKIYDFIEAFLAYFINNYYTEEDRHNRWNDDLFLYFCLILPVNLFLYIAYGSGVDGHPSGLSLILVFSIFPFAITFYYYKDRLFPFIALKLWLKLGFRIACAIGFLSLAPGLSWLYVHNIKAFFFVMITLTMWLVFQSDNNTVHFTWIWIGFLIWLLLKIHSLHLALYMFIVTFIIFFPFFFF